MGSWRLNRSGDQQRPPEGEDLLKWNTRRRRTSPTKKASSVLEAFEQYSQLGRFNR
jgi:hypothetical protein